MSERIHKTELARLSRKFEIGPLREVHRSRLPSTSRPVILSAAAGLLLGVPLYVLGWEALALIAIDLGVAGAVAYAYVGETGEPGGRRRVGVGDGGLVILVGGGQPIILPWASIIDLRASGGDRWRKSHELIGVHEGEPVTVHLGAISDSRGLLQAITNRRPQPRQTRRYATVAASAVAAVAVSAGLMTLPNPFVEKVVPVPRSSLSAEVPSVEAGQLIDALPKPADFGPGWEFDVDSLGREDNIAEAARGELYPTLCEWADPTKAGISTNSAAMVISGHFLSPTHEIIVVSIMVDSPARSAERFSYLRRIKQKCTEITFTFDGEEYTRKITMLPDPKARADESLAYRFADEGGSYGVDGKHACARVDALTICIEGADFPDGVLSTSLNRARAALSI